jgi:NAD(P)-dependent dehydrogenase (short-subunit alcohol dehydrogenase family)
MNTVSMIDILVAKAPGGHVGTAESTTEEDMDRVLRVNIKGVYNCINAIGYIIKITMAA